MKTINALRLEKLIKIRESIIGKIIAFFLMIFVLLLIPTILLTIATFSQNRANDEMIGSITYANRLNTDVSTKIEPIVWDIVAGKTTFDESGITPLVAEIGQRMNYIMENTQSVENKGVMEIALRALGTLSNYVTLLEQQIAERRPVSENESVLEEIRVCVALINELLAEFSSKQLDEVAELNEEISERGNLYFFISGLLLLIVIMFGSYAFWYISRSIMEPIGKLLDMSKKISTGDFGERVSVSASEEFNELADGMNKMSGQIELLIERSVEEQKQIRRLEAKALQAQITPHFLYNTLDAIIWAAEDADTDAVIRLVTSLSKFFRISLSHGIDFITISNEIAHVSSYLVIQKMRYSDVLSYEIDVDESLNNHKILKLLLQPLVENAIYHGIKATRNRGCVKITVSKTDENAVSFCVADNGIGMTNERLCEVREILENEEAPAEKGKAGYGLFNVNRRIKLYYDVSDGVKISSEYGKGTTVSFVLRL